MGERERERAILNKSKTKSAVFSFCILVDVSLAPVAVAEAVLCPQKLQSEPLSFSAESAHWSESSCGTVSQSGAESRNQNVSFVTAGLKLLLVSVILYWHLRYQPWNIKYRSLYLLNQYCLLWYWYWHLLYYISLGVCSIGLGICDIGTVL